MKKIVISSLSLQSLTPTHYKPKSTFIDDYPHEVHYAINALLANTLTKSDQVKVILIKTKSASNVADENEKIFRDEFNEINSKCGATIEGIITVEVDADPDNKQLRTIFLQIAKELSYNAKIYADFTYGLRSNPILLMTVLQFAEKYYNAEITNVVYGKAEFTKDRKLDHDKSAIYDLTSLYGLNSLFNAMQASSAEKAIQAIDTFFTM